MDAVLSQPGRARVSGAAPPLLFAAGVWLVLQVVAVAGAISPVAQGLLIDTDSYMKLVRIENLLATGGWFDSRIARSNAPFGETLHWTRLFDVIVILGAGLLRPFMELREAVFWSGAFVSPLLNLALIFALVWAARPLLAKLSVEALAVAAVLTVAQPSIFSYSLPGRADHHVLLMLLFALLVGMILHALRRAPDERLAARKCALAGAIAGLGVWASVELLLAAAAAGTALGVAWVLEGRRWLRINLAYAAGLVASTAIAILIERAPAELFAVESDRISVMQLAAALALLAVWTSIAAASRFVGRSGRPVLRLAGAGFAAALAGALLLAAFPTFLSGPIGAVDPIIRAIWFDNVVEMQPLWPHSRESAAALLKLLGIGLAALPFLAWLLLEERRDPAFLARLGVVVVTAAVLPVALAHQRFAPYAEALLGMALAELLRRAFERASAAVRPASRALWRVLPAVVVFLGPVLIGAKLETRASGADTSPAGPTCSVKELAPFLNALAADNGRRPLTVLAMIDIGPELLYRTSHRVIGTPYHRNAAGIRDSYAGLASAEAEARRVLGARQVDLVLLCPKTDRSFYIGGSGDSSLYNRLLRGDVPQWLAPVPLPDPSLEAAFKIFRVVRP
jgi:asparagine N-glycosylation enzyme membrane subunit Stt3